MDRSLWIIFDISKQLKSRPNRQHHHLSVSFDQLCELKEQNSTSPQKVDFFASISNWKDSNDSIDVQVRPQVQPRQTPMEKFKIFVVIFLAPYATFKMESTTTDLNDVALCDIVSDGLLKALHYPSTQLTIDLYSHEVEIWFGKQKKIQTKMLKKIEQFVGFFSMIRIAVIDDSRQEPWIILGISLPPRPNLIAENKMRASVAHW